MQNQTYAVLDSLNFDDNKIIDVVYLITALSYTIQFLQHIQILLFLQQIGFIKMKESLLEDTIKIHLSIRDT